MCHGDVSSEMCHGDVSSDTLLIRCRRKYVLRHLFSIVVDLSCHC